MFSNNNICENQMNNIKNLSKSHIVAINCGYGNTKVKYEKGTIIFKSQISSYVDESLQDTIFIDGIRYVVGTGKYNLELDKTSNLQQRILIEYALSKIPYDDLKVIVAMPCNSYINKAARNDYKNFIESFDKIQTSIIYPEGASLSILDYPFFKDKLVMLLDIGHYTINFLLFDDANLIKDKSFSRDLGCYILMSRIRKALEQNSLSNIPDYQLKYMLDNPIVEKVIDDYVEEIKLEIVRMQYPTNIQYVRCTGGGSLFLKERLIKEFNAKITDDAIFENVNGLYYIGSKVFAHE